MTTCHMWPYFNVPLYGYIRQVWLYIYYLKMLIVTSRNRLFVFCDKHRNACVCCRFKIQDFIFLPDRNFQNNFMWPCIDWITSLISKSCRKQQVSNTSVTLTFIDISICPQCISKSEAVVVVITWFGFITTYAINAYHY